jgi:hypothetical protein
VTQYTTYPEEYSMSLENAYFTAVGWSILYTTFSVWLIELLLKVDHWCYCPLMSNFSIISVNVCFICLGTQILGIYIYNYYILFFDLFYCYAGWEYIVAFIKVIAMLYFLDKFTHLSLYNDVLCPLWQILTESYIILV